MQNRYYVFHFLSKKSYFKKNPKKPRGLGCFQPWLKHEFIGLNKNHKQIYLNLVSKNK